MRERDRQRDRETGRQAGRQTDRQTDRQTGGQTGLLSGVRSTPVLPQWNAKGAGNSAKSAGSRLHLNMHTPLT